MYCFATTFPKEYNAFSSLWKTTNKTAHKISHRAKRANFFAQIIVLLKQNSETKKLREKHSEKSYKTLKEVICFAVSKKIPGLAAGSVVWIFPHNLRIFPATPPSVFGGNTMPKVSSDFIKTGRILYMNKKQYSREILWISLTSVSFKAWDNWDNWDS